MNKKFFIPLRFKILFSLLMGMTVVVGVITFTMGTLFHTDKTAYINDLISTTTMHTAQETHSLVLNYYQKIKIITRVAYDVGIAPDEKSKCSTISSRTFRR